MKIIYTDRDESPAMVLEPEQFLDAIKEKQPAKVIDINPDYEQPKPETKKSNAWIWAIVAIVIIMAILGILYYLKIQKEKQNTETV